MTVEIRSELVAQVFAIEAAVGDVVDDRTVLMVLESMKMEIPVLAECGGVVVELRVQTGASVREGDVLAVVDPVPPSTPLRPVGGG